MNIAIVIIGISLIIISFLVYYWVVRPTMITLTRIKLEDEINYLLRCETINSMNYIKNFAMACTEPNFYLYTNKLETHKDDELIIVKDAQGNTIYSEKKK